MKKRSSLDVRFVTKVFPLNSKMNKHVVLVHEEEKQFRCEICDYSFSLMSKMNRHFVFLHKGKKPFD